MQLSELELKQWMTSGLDGDAEAHAKLLRVLVPTLTSFFRRRIGGSLEDVEDLVQDTIISVHERRTSYDRDRPFTPWLYAIARYRMIDHFRKLRKSVSIDDVDSLLLQDGLEEVISARVDVRSLLSTLSQKQADAILHTHVEGLSVAEAAERAGIGQSDVKISVHRGLKALAARIRGASDAD